MSDRATKVGLVDELESPINDSNPFPVDFIGTITANVENFPSEYPLPAAQVSTLTPQTDALTDIELRATPVPISGTVTANAGTNLNTSLLALESGGNLDTIAGDTTSIDGKITTCDTDNVQQSTHDNLNANANLQVGDTDVSDSNPAVTRSAAYVVRYVVNSGDTNVYYLGKAVPGTATSAASWQIKEIDYTTGTVITLADGDSNFDNIWDNRESLSYS